MMVLIMRKKKKRDKFYLSQHTHIERERERFWLQQISDVTGFRERERFWVLLNLLVFWFVKFLEFQGIFGD
jgi:hypothetical protein